MLLGHTWMCPGELSQGRARLCAPCGGAQKAPNAAPHTLEMSHGMCQDKDTVVGWHQGRFTGTEGCCCIGLMEDRALCGRGKEIPALSTALLPFLLGQFLTMSRQGVESFFVVWQFHE